jgi:hypothetical protein
LVLVEMVVQVVPQMMAHLEVVLYLAQFLPLVVEVVEAVLVEAGLLGMVYLVALVVAHLILPTKAVKVQRGKVMPLVFLTIAVAAALDQQQ